jgi:hypothetical protein
MQETLLEAENKSLKARIEFLELKLSLLSENEQRGEYLDLHQLNMKQLLDVGMQLGKHFNSGWDKRKRVYFLRHCYGMAKVLKVVKDMQSRGLHKDIGIFNLHKIKN